MSRESLEQRASLLVSGLEHKVYQALLRAAPAAQRDASRNGISVEHFLAALYLVFGEEILSEFERQDSFLALQESVLPENSPVMPEYGEVGVAFIRQDTELRDLLWNAIRLAKGLEMSSAGVREIFAALCLQDATVSRLRNSYNINFIRYIEPLF